MGAWRNVKEFFGFVEENPEPEQLPAPANADNGSNPPVLKTFKGQLVNSNQTRQVFPSEIKVEEPRIYEDSLNIATHLREKKPVIVNLKYLDADAGKRLIDFVCGTAYAINGHMMKIGESIFLFTPENVQIVDSSEKSTFEQGIAQEEKEIFFKKTANG
jgi:cell division inhibitor SepF